jgi:hypothetical protein
MIDCLCIRTVCNHICDNQGHSECALLLVTDLLDALPIDIIHIIACGRKTHLMKAILRLGKKNHFHPQAAPQTVSFNESNMELFCRLLGGEEGVYFRTLIP